MIDFNMMETNIINSDINEFNMNLLIMIKL